MQAKSRILAMICAMLALAGGLAAAPAAPAFAAPQQSRPARIERAAGIGFHAQSQVESAAGKPGWRAHLDWLDTHSATVKNAAEIGRYINGQVLDSVFTLRRETAEQQDSQLCADMAGSGAPCENEIYFQSAGISAKGQVISVHYIYMIAPFAAAHPMTYPVVYNFALRPLFRLGSLADLFAEPDKALPIVQAKIRAALLAQHDEQGAPLLPDKAQVEAGTADWAAFSIYSFDAQGLKVEFAPYAVGPYAAGPQAAELPYTAIKPLLKPFYRAALALQ